MVKQVGIFDINTQRDNWQRLRWTVSLLGSANENNNKSR